MGRLRILTAGIEPAVLEIPADVVTLGRRDDNALCVPHASVSGRHCELGEADDSLTILDLGSTNGTFIKGQRIEQGTVAAGETFFLGGVEVRYEVGAPNDGAEPPRAAPTLAPVAPTAAAAAAASAPKPAPAHDAVSSAPAPPAVGPSSTAAAAETGAEPATISLPPPAPAPVPTAEKPKGVFPPMPPQPKPGAPLLPKPAMPKSAMPNPATSDAAALAVPKVGAAEGPKPAVQKAAAPLPATNTPAAKPAAAPLVGGMPKVIVPPSEPPKLVLGHHAKPHAAPPASPKPEGAPSTEAAAAPAAEHGAAASPAAPKPAAPLGGGGPKVIVPPSGPPKFSLGSHAKPHAAPPAAPKPEGAPSPEAAAAPAAEHGAAAAPAAPKPAVPLGGGGPKVIVPPSEPPKFSLGGHAKPHAAPPASPKPEGAPSPEAATTPASEHGAAAAPAAPKPAVPLGGGGPKVIVPPSGPPKFSLGSHAKPHAAPPASPKPEGTPSPEAATTPTPDHGAAPAPAAPKPAVPLGGGGPKVIVPPSGPPKFSLGSHAKPHAAPPASPKPEGAPSPEAADAPAAEHGAAASPAAPKPPKPAAPLSGGGPKVIVPPSAPPKFSLGSHAKPHATPPASPASPGAATAPAVAPAPPAAPASEAEPIAEMPAEATAENATESATKTAAESASENPGDVAADAAPDAPAPAPPAPAPPAPVAATAAPPAAASQSAPAKDANRCARHPANVAQYICPKCRAYACDTCGSLSAARGKPKVFCPVCGAKAQPLAEFEAVQAARRAREDLSFQQQVKGVFKYPFGKGGLALLIIGSLMFFGLDVLVTWGWKFRFVMLKTVSSVGILALFSAGYLCAWLQKILFATAEGEDDVPGWPDFMDWKDDIVMPFRLAIAAAVASFGPAFGYLIFHAVNNSEMRLPVLFPLFALGFIYFPMALLAVAMSNNWLAVNPLVVMPAIARLNLQYVLACVVFFGMVLVRFVSESLLHVVLPIPVLPGLISSFIALYFLCVEMRLLGLLYVTNKKRLGWFST